jgi:signal transduction histidine kinase
MDPHDELKQEFSTGQYARVEDDTGEPSATADAERQQRRLRQRLQVAGTLASGIAHEINNPLNIIMNYAELILDAVPEGVVRSHAQAILEESERISALVRSLQAFSRTGVVGLAEISADDLTDETLLLVGKLLRSAQVEIEREVAAALPTVRCRRPQLQQALVNLITNAAEALEGLPPDARERRVRLRVAEHHDEAGAWLRFTVEDNGPGIAAGDLERVFDPFYTTRTRAEKAGLGLTVVYETMREHGGRVNLASEPGQGTQATLDLPIGA